ncbi:MAG: rhomboid family intramembrane serine protease [Candidatus Obscuribacterales bacterium]|nr:rhomboid family intramembrane serine protease [Candidatus Obscuribacterales bacterium]
MTIAHRRKRELLKPPEHAPVVTYLLMALAAFNTGEPSYQWVQEHAITAQKLFSAFQAGDLAKLFFMTYNATFAQLGVWSLLLNLFFFWIFGVTVEKRLVSWRYPLFILIGMFLTWALVSYDSTWSPTKLYLGPTMLLVYMMGGYIAFKPKKPFKPAEWKSPPWKVFKEDEESEHNRVKVPWVSPWLYIILFVLYTFAMHLVLSQTSQKFVEITHVGFSTILHRGLVGGLGSDTVSMVRLMPALEALAVGYFVAQILIYMVFQRKVKRDASDLQVQTFLQYRELRALDMTHLQAIEGASRLVGVPEDIAREWIDQGLQPVKDSNDT